MAVTQSHYRFGIDQGTEATHGWYAAEDTSPAPGAIPLNTTFLLRFTLQCDATLLSNIDAEFQYRKNGGTWTQITTSTSNVKAVTPTCWADAANTTKRLSGTGTFEASSAGCTADGISGGTAFDIVASGNGETECALQLVSDDLAPGDLIEFRLTRDGGVLMDTYAVTPSLQQLNNPSFDYRRIATGPFPFPKEGRDWFPPLQSSGNGNLSGLSASAAVGLMVATVTLALSGVAATASQGSVTTPIDVASTGVTAAGAVGLLGPFDTLAASGASSTGATGTLVGEDAPTLGGFGLSGSLGSLSSGVQYIERPRVVIGPFPFPKERPAFPIASPSFQVTGLEASASSGSVGATVSLGLSGLAATSALGTTQPTVGLSGVQGAGAVGGGTTLFFTSGLSGVVATGLQGNVPASTPGSGDLTGVAGVGGAGVLTPVFTFAETGLEATGGVGAIRGDRLTIDRPHALSGPFPFLTGGFFQFRERPRLIAPVSQPITVQLTGVAGTGARGSLTVSAAPTLTGRVGTGVQGSPTAAFAVATSGVEASQSDLGDLGFAQALAGATATGSLGSATLAFTIGVNGVETLAAISSVGAQTGQNSTIQLSGVDTPSALGTLAISMTRAETGVQSAGAQGSVAIVPAVTLSLSAITSAVGALAPSSSGTATLTGISTAAQLGVPNGVGSRIPTGQEADGGVGVPVARLVIGLTGLSAIATAADFAFATSSLGTISIVESIDHVIEIPAQGRTFTVGAKRLPTVTLYRRPGALVVKAPSSDEPYRFDWGPYCQSLPVRSGSGLLATCVTASEWVVDGPDNALTLHDAAVVFDPAADLLVTGPLVTQVYLSGGTEGARYTVTNRVDLLTRPVLTEERSFDVFIQGRMRTQAPLVVKDPGADDSDGLDLTLYLREMDLYAPDATSLVSSVWTISGPDALLILHDDGVVLHPGETNPRVTRIYYNGGTNGARYRLTNRFVTNTVPPVTDERSFDVFVQNL